MRFPFHRCLSFATLLALLAAFAGCGGGNADAEDRGGFDPVTCSAQPSPCA